MTHVMTEGGIRRLIAPQSLPQTAYGGQLPPVEGAR
ncbi:hypothetical protein D2E23_0243 [Bifidobacterium callimiconis]|uniref:Uncharacterized protein n=1 Tax=Bifidobacterium callimiconis TaxID=2306973 RepID=A0A430FHZ1_9BIFI|nr:hypothetical protein D2E23_0243 [Bifidobacterium callimiconis]